MFKNALTLMRQLRTLIVNESDEIWIDYENKMFSRLQDEHGPVLESPFPKNEASVSGLLCYLQDEGFVNLDPHDPYIVLTYKALYYEKLRRSEIIEYIKKSVLVPIFLTLATNFILFLIRLAGIIDITPLLQLLQRLAQLL